MPERGGEDQGYTKARVLVLVRSPELISHKWHELVSSGRFLLPMSHRLSLVFRILFCFIFFVFCFLCVGWGTIGIRFKIIIGFS